MINARTWHRLCASAYVMFPGAIITWTQPDGSILFWIGLVGVIWGIIIGITGALLGIAFAAKRLYLGCPECCGKAHVTGGNRTSMYLSCPQCGPLELTVGRLFGMKITRLSENESEQSHAEATSKTAPSAASEASDA